ncbi:13348_t:CDS:2 [Entrophospora sp. SA101]|nr:4213_t:CDS:2 [Entrophospora sp. SA101]CAJ0831283.1 13348_t:CDS:2 [Entrophospora sp. SA101]
MNTEIPINPINFYSQNIVENGDNDNETEEHHDLDVELENEIINTHGQGGYHNTY